MATGDAHTKFCEDQSSSSRDMLANGQTDRQTNWSQYSAPLRGQSKNTDDIRYSLLWNVSFFPW